MPNDSLDSYIDVDSVNPVQNRDMIDVYRDPLFFDLDDDTFLDYAARLKRESDTFWDDKGNTGLNLKERRKHLETYYFGRQFFGIKTAKYNSKAQDNILYEAMEYISAMAVAKMPDITVTPANDTDDAKEVALKVSQVETLRLASRERKRVLSKAFEHRPVYLTGAIKVFWNTQKGKFGDIDYKVVFPENLTLDFRAISNDPNDMDYLFETCEYTVKELTMMFPTKKEKLFAELHRFGTFGRDDNSANENNERGMNSKVKIQEVWFRWYDQPTEDKKKWQTIIGCGWYFQRLLLGKMKHPYWDWTGKPQTYSLEYKEIKGTQSYTKKQTPLNAEQLLQSMAGQQLPNIQTVIEFKNHLDVPEFPYIFLGKSQWGKTPIDETSEMEQAIPLQEDYDQTMRQIAEMLVRSRGKHVFSSNEGLKKSDIREMDLGDPYQDVLIAGDVGRMHVFIPGEQPGAALLQEKQDSRERIFDKLGVHQATRGAASTDTAATNNQLNREGDFTRMDKLVDDTITYASEKMANWDMQLMKLFYTENHLIHLLGEDGKWLNTMLHRDELGDGMKIIISASGSDKLKAEQRAMDMAKIKLIDPYRFYKDTGSSDPKGRTLALMNFLMQPQLYMQDVKAGGDGTGSKGVQQAAGTVSGQSPQAQQDIMQIEQGQVPQPPQQIDEAYFQTFTAFMHSPQVEQAIQQFGDQFKQALIQFAQSVSQLASQQGLGNGQQPQQAQQGQPQATQPSPTGGGAAVGPVGPASQNPNPANTSRINLNAPR